MEKQSKNDELDLESAINLMEEEIMAFRAHSEEIKTAIPSYDDLMAKTADSLPSREEASTTLLAVDENASALLVDIFGNREVISSLQRFQSRIPHLSEASAVAGLISLNYMEMIHWEGDDSVFMITEKGHDARMRKVVEDFDEKREHIISEIQGLKKKISAFITENRIYMQRENSERQITEDSLIPIDEIIGTEKEDAVSEEQVFDSSLYASEDIVVHSEITPDLSFRRDSEEEEDVLNLTDLEVETNENNENGGEEHPQAEGDFEFDIDPQPVPLAGLKPPGDYYFVTSPEEEGEKTKEDIKTKTLENIKEEQNQGFPIDFEDEDDEVDGLTKGFIWPQGDDDKK